MGGMKQTDPTPDTGSVLDGIEQAVYAAVKSQGFRKYGRTLHRFVSEDISQVINFQLGQAYRGENHLLFVNVGIRVPECVTRSFAPEKTMKKYYHEYECNMRARFGEIEGEKASCYDLRQNTDGIVADIMRQIQEFVMPVFEILNSRDAILARRRDYPQFDLLNNHLILLEEAMIYGRRGEMKKASETFRQHYHLCGSGQLAQKDQRAIQGHLRYLDALASELGMEIQ